MVDFVTRISREILTALRSDLSSISDVQRGIEKESLRVSGDGALSLQSHPPALGAGARFYQTAATGILVDFSANLTGRRATENL